MIKAIIFDIDGVLVNSEEFYFKRRMNFFKENNLTPGSTDINDFVGSNVIKIWDTLVPDDEKLREELKNSYLTNYEKNHQIDFKKYSRENLKELFQSLQNKSIRIALASAGSKYIIRKFIDDMELGQYIEFFESGEECKNNKPDPEIYLNSIKKFNLANEEIIVVEDSELGIQAAKDANLKVIALKPSNYYLNQDQADYQISDLSQIKDYL